MGGKENTPSIPKYRGLFWRIDALNQTWPSNRTAPFWISVNQIANLEVSFNPKNMCFKIMYIYVCLNDDDKYWIPANQITNFRVSINSTNMYFKTMNIFFWFWGYFSFFGKHPILKKSTVFRNVVSSKTMNKNTGPYHFLSFYTLTQMSSDSKISKKCYCCSRTIHFQWIWV